MQIQIVHELLNIKLALCHSKPWLKLAGLRLHYYYPKIFSLHRKKGKLLLSSNGYLGWFHCRKFSLFTFCSIWRQCPCCCTLHYFSHVTYIPLYISYSTSLAFHLFISFLTAILESGKLQRESCKYRLCFQYPK